MKQNIYLLVSLVLVVLVGYMVIQSQHTRLTFSNFGAVLPENHKILGIDVSHHQGQIDWNMVTSMSVKGDTIAFVYLKLSEGVDFKDSEAENNISTLSETDLPFGVYHFFRPQLSASKQADFFAKNCPKSYLKPVIDVEVNGDLSAKQLIDSVKVFLNAVEKTLKVRPLIYTYESFYNDYFKSSTLKEEWFWIANYTRKSKVYNDKHTLAWQFSESGTIDGISEKVDLNTAKTKFWEAAKW